MSCDSDAASRFLTIAKPSGDVRKGAPANRRNFVPGRNTPAPTSGKAKGSQQPSVEIGKKGLRASGARASLGRIRRGVTALYAYPGPIEPVPPGSRE